MPRSCWMPWSGCPARFGGNRPAGVVVFSDGRTTETAGFKEAAEGYRKWKVPLHVLSGERPGHQGRRRDSGTGDSAFRSAGHEGARPRAVRQLRLQGPTDRNPHPAAANPWAKPLAALPVTLAGGPQTHDLMIDLDPARQRNGRRSHAARRRGHHGKQSGAVPNRIVDQETPRDLHGSDARRRIPLAPRRAGRRSQHRMPRHGGSGPVRQQSAAPPGRRIIRGDIRRRGKNCFVTTS